MPGGVEMIGTQSGSSNSGCFGEYHVWMFAGDRPDGFTFNGWPCACGQKIWVDTECETCGHKSGKQVDAAKYNKPERLFGTHIMEAKERLLDFIAKGERI